MKLLIVIITIISYVATHPIARIRDKEAKARVVAEQRQNSDTPIDEIEMQADQPRLLNDVPVEVQPAYTYVCMLPAPCKILYKIFRLSEKKDPESYIKALLPYVPYSTEQGQSICSFEVPCDKVPDYAQHYVFPQRRYFY